jgi:protein-S-isoprenylcysteine O-methyltransferase Ste14
MSSSARKKRMPLFFTIAGVVCLGGFALHRLILVDEGTGRLLGVACLACYVAWMLWELRITVSELSRQEARGDKSSLEVVAVAKILMLAGAFAGGGTIRPALAAVGLGLLILGVLLRAWAISLQGRAYSHRIRTPPRVIRGGPYALIRHPAYLGTLLGHTGLVLVFCNTFSVAALAALWYPSVLWRTVVEDRFLCAQSGYRGYAARVRARLVPGLW